MPKSPKAAAAETPTTPKRGAKAAPVVTEVPASAGPTKEETAAAKTPKTPRKAAAGERPMPYPKFNVIRHWTDPTDPLAVGPLDQAKIKDILGLEVETEGVTFGDEFTFKDVLGNKVRCTKNMKNREFKPKVEERLRQEHLNRRWAGPECMPGKTVNGESIIIDKFGDLHEGQHTLIAAYNAELERGADTPEGKHWRKLWPTPVTVDKLVVVGIDPSDDVVNTINTGTSRTLYDVLFRSEQFAKMGKGKRARAAKLADMAIKTILDRTGLRKDAWETLQTHSMTMAFLDAHPKVMVAVSHIMEEDGKGRIAKIINPGVAAGILYLMGACDGDGAKYRAADEPTERRAGITKENWDKAEEFWGLLPENPAFGDVKRAVAYAQDSMKGLGGRLAEKVDVMVRAWNEFKQPGFKQFKVENVGTAIDEQEVPCCRPRYATDANGTRSLVERPTLGGIDLAPAAVTATPTAADEADEVAEPTEETAAETATRAAAELAARTKETADEAAEAKGAVKDFVTGTDLVTVLTDVRKANPGKLLLFVSNDLVRAYGHDHKTLAEQQWGFMTIGRAGALRYAEFPLARLHDVLDVLTDPVKYSEMKVGVCKIGADGTPGAVSDPLAA